MTCSESNIVTELVIMMRMAAGGCRGGCKGVAEYLDTSFSKSSLEVLPTEVQDLTKSFCRLLEM